MRLITAFSYPFLQKKKLKAVPLRGVEQLQDGYWQATDHDPQFKLKGVFPRLLSGWVSIHVHVVSGQKMTPKLYLDFGKGYAESLTVCMQPTHREGEYHAQLVLNEPLKGIRFDPAEVPCRFYFSDISLSVHSELLHIYQQLVTLMMRDYRELKDPFAIVRKSHVRYKKHGWAGMVERLEKEYKALHPSKTYRNTPHYLEYMQWIEQNEQNRLEAFSEEQFLRKPLISIVMATYNTPEKYLKKALDSVLDQSYPHWELCIADDASTNNKVRKILKVYAKKDRRIKIVFREENGHISAASNTALSLAAGEYVALMDHDDMLAPNALLEVVKCINRNPEVKLIYSDEDKIDEQDRRYDPHFKSGWNPDMFYSYNYISHLSVIESTVLKTAGGLREGYEGAQDYDLFLRVIEQINDNAICHIEKILYHWRALAGSTAYASKQKPYTANAGLKALNNHFAKKAPCITVIHGLLPNTYKISYPLENEPLVSLIVPTRDGYDILSKCISSILEKTDYKNYEIIIVDNETTDPKTLHYFDMLEQSHSHIHVIPYHEAFNYSAINNYAVKKARGEIIGLINNDVEVISQHWLTEMVQHAVRPEIGAVGAKLYYDNDTIQHAGVILGIGGVAGHAHKYFKREEHGYFSRLKIIQNCSAVTGACLVVRKELYEAVGGLDEAHLKVAFNDVDLCLKIMQKGYRNIWTPYVELYHHESVSRGAEDDEVKQKRFQKEVEYMKKKWGKILKEDPFYNTNLTKKYENFGLCSNV